MVLSNAPTASRGGRRISLPVRFAVGADRRGALAESAVVAGSAAVTSARISTAKAVAISTAELALTMGRSTCATPAGSYSARTAWARAVARTKATQTRARHSNDTRTAPMTLNVACQLLLGPVGRGPLPGRSKSMWTSWDAAGPQQERKPEDACPTPVQGSDAGEF